MLDIGVFGRSRKENEFRLPIHPRHLERIDHGLRAHLYVEEGYGQRFGITEQRLAALVAGIRTREELIETCDVILHPKPLAAELTELRDGQVLWGWPHCVQDERLTQNAIDRELTLIAWEAMNHWQEDGTFGLHVFHKNNELAGYCSVLQAMQLLGLTGDYGRTLRAGVISFGATGRGAVTALNALGIYDVTVMTGRDPAAVASPPHHAHMVQYGPGEDGRLVVTGTSGSLPMPEALALNDIVVNCVLQDPDDPDMFVMNDELGLFKPGNVIIDVSCDAGMGFEWARPTTFDNPMVTVGERVHYYAVDHSPSHLWDSATWEISEALLPYLPVIMAGPDAWTTDDTIARAIEIREGVVQNPKILSFQGRSPEYPHPKSSAPDG